MKRVHALLAVVCSLGGAVAACGGLSASGKTKTDEAGAAPDTGNGSGSGTGSASSGGGGSGTSSGTSSGPNGSRGSSSSSGSSSSGSGGNSSSGNNSSSGSSSSGGIGSASSSASGNSSSSGSSGSNGSSGGGSGSGGSSSGGSGETILFSFSQSTDVPGGGYSMCPNDTKGCWFWDEYDPACSIPLGNSEAGAGDGATPCTYPNVQPMLSFDSAVADTNPGGDPGSMRIQVPFTAYNQQSLVEWYVAGAPLNWSTKTLFARLRFDAGGNPNLASNPNGFRLIVKTGTTYVSGPSQYFNLIQSGQAAFEEYDFPLTAPPLGAGAGWDASQVVAIELEFDTGSPVSGVDAGVPAMATFHIDTIGTVP